MSRDRGRVVLHVILTTQRAGTERQVVELCAAMRDRGWDTHIAASASADERVLRDYASVAHLHVLPAQPLVLLAPRVARIARSVGSGVVHGHYGKATLLALIAARAAGARAATTLHLLDLAHAARRTARLQRLMYRAMIGRLDVVIAISAAVRERAIQDGLVAADDVVVVHNGIADTPGWVPPEKRGEHALYVGRLSAEKQVELAIIAVAATSSARLRVVGAGPEERRLRDLAAEALPGRCEFLGYQENPWEEMRAARVLLMPSAAEPFGLVAIEAMAQECPVCGFAAGGLVEIVQDGRSGLLAEPGDTREFGVNASGLLSDPRAAAELGRNARARYRELFTANLMAERVEKMYSRSV